MAWMDGVGLERLWSRIKSYIADTTYPRGDPPDLLFDPDTSTLYLGKPHVGYDFIVSGAEIYYKERS